MIFTENDESSESLHSKWRKSNDKMQTQENDMLISASDKSHISASTFDNSITVSSFELKNDNSSLNENNIINLHRNSISWVEQHEVTVQSSSQQMKSQQNMMIFDTSFKEDIAKKSKYVQSHVNFNDVEDSEKTLKKHYAIWLRYRSWSCFLINKIEQTHDEDIIDCYKAFSWRRQMTKLCSTVSA